jgi:hypothetical protein
MTKQQDSEENDLMVMTEEFGLRQTAEGAQKEETIVVIQKAIEYMNGETMAALPDKIQENCMNRNELCSFWSAIGVSIAMFSSFFLFLSGPVEQDTHSSCHSLSLVIAGVHQQQSIHGYQLCAELLHLPFD